MYEERCGAMFKFCSSLKFQGKADAKSGPFLSQLKPRVKDGVNTKTTNDVTIFKSPLFYQTDYNR
jgi:hypothetical protein